MTSHDSLPTQVDVLVVGYGPVGAALAVLLGRHGVRVLVIDRAPDILMNPRAIALDNEALRILQMAGLPDDAFATREIPCVRMHSPVVGTFAVANTAGRIDGHPKLVTFYQPDLERALRNAVAAQPTVEVGTAVELTGFDDHGNGILARVRRADGRETTVAARYLVGTDGAASTVRKAIGQAFSGSTYGEDWLIVDAFGDPGAFDHVEFLCDPARPTPHMVAPGGRIRWEFMLRPGETREQMESDATLDTLLAPWGGTTALTIERRAVYRFHARSCTRYSRGRVFLAGDAAHITPPFVGQGLVSGLRDAANLAWKLAWVIHGRADAAILDSYDRERRPHATRMIALAKWMGRLVMPRNRPAALLIHGAMALLRTVPPLRRHVEELAIKPANRFRRGLFVPGRDRLRRGAQLPQGRLRTVDGRIVRSDDALGDALVLVGFGVDAEARLTPETRRRWQAAGGTALCVEPSGIAPHGTAVEDLDSTLLPTAAPPGWCGVLRPDRTVLHDGPAADADRIVAAALALLGRTPASEIAPFPTANPP